MIFTQEHEQYNPDYLLDVVKEALRIKYDAGLARRLCVGAPFISKLRHRRIRITADLLITMHEETNFTIAKLRFLGGDFRNHTGRSAIIVPPNARRPFFK